MTKKHKTPTLESFARLADLQELCSTIALPVHQSSMHSAFGCARRFLYTHRLFIYPRIPDSLIDALTRGQMIHKYFELDNETAFDEWAVQKAEEIRSIASENEDVFGQVSSIIDQHYKEVSMAKMIGQLYHEKVPVNPNHKIIGKEQYILAHTTISAVSCYLAGTLDQIIQSSLPGHIGIRDFKTTSKTPETAFAGYSFGLQNRMYRLLTYLYTGMIPEFFVLDIISLPSIRMSQEDRNFVTETKVLKSGPNKGQIQEVKKFIGEPTFDNYIERCRLWYANNATNPITSFSIRYAEPILTHEFVPYLLDTWNLMIIPPVYPNFSRDLTCLGCNAYNRTCPYLPLCQSSENTHMELMKQKYTFKPPTQYLINNRNDGTLCDRLYSKPESKNDKPVTIIERHE